MCCALEIPSLCLCWFCCFHAILGSQLRSQGFQSGKGFLLFDNKNRNRRRNSESLQRSFFSNLPREDLSHFGYIWAGPRRMLFGNTQQDSGVPSLVLPWSIEALISEFVEILRSCRDLGLKDGSGSPGLFWVNLNFYLGVGDLALLPAALLCSKPPAPPG